MKNEMLKNQYFDLIIVLIIAILTCVIWNVIETPLNNENLQLSEEISEISISGKEIIKYGIISFLIAIVIILPFFRDKEFSPKISYPIGGIVLTLVFIFSAYLVDQNIKGIYLVKYIGDDFPFIGRIILYFLFFPIALYLIISMIIDKIKKRNIILFALIGLISTFLSYAENEYYSWFAIKDFREIVAEGHFLIWATLFLGIHFWIIKKKKTGYNKG